jgi:uncharacterized membrane protein YjgN (DUF898 family)
MSENYSQYQPAPYGHPNAMVAREHPQGTLVLVLGILGVFVAGICAPFAWYLGSKALKEARASGVTYSNQQQLVVGRVLGIIMTVIAILGILFGVVALVVLVAAAGASSQ